MRRERTVTQPVVVLLQEDLSVRLNSLAWDIAEYYQPSIKGTGIIELDVPELIKRFINDWNAR